jgi:hypothetical protein
MENTAEKVYIGTYKVVRVFKVSRRKEVLRRGLTRQEAMDLVNSYPSKSQSMVIFDKQFSADKYFK